MKIDRTSANDAINSMIIGKDAKNWKHKFISTEECPRCDVDSKIVYSPKFGPIMDDKEDALVRGKNLHESAHARLTPSCAEVHAMDKVMHNIANALEDVRIEQVISAMNPVIREDIYNMNVELNKEFNRKMMDESTECPPINEALAAMMFKAQGLPVHWKMSEKAQKYFDCAFDIFNEIKYIKKIDSKDGFSEVLRLAKEIYERFKEEKEKEKEEQKQQQQQEQQKEGSEEQNNSTDSDSSEQKDDKKEKSEKHDDGSKDEKSHEKSDEEKDDPSSQKGSEEENDDKSSESSVEKGESTIDSDDSDSECGCKSSEDSGLEDECGEDLKEKILKEKIKDILEKSLEKSDGYTAYSEKDGFVTVEENIDKYEKSRDAISVQIGRLSRYVEESLRSLSRCQKISGLERGRIDRKKLVGLSKSLTKKVFYKKNDGIDLDVSCTLLVDESGSIRNMQDQLRTLTIAFAEVFEKIGINFEVLGFTTFDWETPDEYEDVFDRSIAIKMKVYKSFKENYGATKYRLGNITAEKQNVDGESLLYANERLQRERTRRKVIFVLSDGVPSCGYKDKLLCDHLKTCVENIRSNGTEIYAFGIGTSEPRKYYGADNFVYLESCRELGPVFFNRFKEIVAKK